MLETDVRVARTRAPWRALLSGMEGFACLLALGILVMRWPYRGVRHDGVLYLGQALTHLDASWARADIFFAYGSQDKFSVFSHALALAIRWLGVERAELALLIVASAASLAVVVALARHLPAPARWMAPIAVLATSHFYGSARIFSFFEPFLTARSWAEPLSLLALLLLMRGRLAAALLAWSLAALCHPLVALPVAFVAWGWLLQQDRRWAWAALIVLPVAGLVAAGVPPFPALLRTYDDPWFHVVILANPAVFLSMWNRSEFAIAIGTVVLLWWAARRLSGAPASLCRATAIMSVLLCLVSFALGDFWHDILVTQLQLWRVLWLATLLALLVLPHLVLALLRQGVPGRLAAASLLLAVLACDGSPENAWALIVWALLVVAATRSGRLDAVTPRLLNLATAGVVLAAVLLTGTQAVNIHSQLLMHSQGMAIGRPGWIPVALPLVSISAALGLLWLHASGGRRRHLALAGLMVLLVVGASGWDQRTAWQRYVEQTPPGSHPFAALIPPDAQVAWGTELLPTWLLLERPSYLSAGQAAGVLFTRGSAMSVFNRLQRSRTLISRDERCRRLEWLGFPDGSLQSCEFPRAAFLHLCATSGPGRPADFLIAPVDLGVLAEARWRFTPDDGEPATTWRLYDCKPLRDGAPHDESVTPAHG